MGYAVNLMIIQYALIVTVQRYAYQTTMVDVPLAARMHGVFVTGLALLVVFYLVRGLLDAPCAIKSLFLWL